MSFYDDSTLLFLAAGAVYKDGKINTIKPAAPNTRAPLLVTRGSNLTATRVDSNGLIEKGRENLLLKSNLFDNGGVPPSSWSTSNASVTSGQSGYDGSSDAWLLENISGSAAYVLQSKVVNGVQTASVYAKSGTVDYIYLRLGGSSSRGLYVNLSNGTIYSTFGTLIDYNVDSVGNDWYRISVTYEGNHSNFRIYPSASGSTSTSLGDNIYIQDAQLEQGLVATEYIESGASTGKAGLLENEPRFNYPIGGGSPHLLLEPQRSNLIGQSEYFDNWTNSEETDLSVNNTTSPEGVQNAYSITPQATSDYHRIFKSVYSLVSGNQYSFSFFAKPNGNDFILFRTQISGGNKNVCFNISNGTIDFESSFADDATIEDYGNGWYRCSVVWTAATTTQQIYLRSQISSQVGTDDGIDTFTGNGRGAYLYGAQLEAGSYPTSYIPNHSGGSVSREFDLVQTADVSSSNLIGQNEGVFFLDFEFLDGQTAENQNWIALESENGQERVLIYKSASAANLRGYLSANNSVVFQINDLTPITANTRYKVAFKYSTNDQAIYVNGSQAHVSSHAYTRGSNLSRLLFNESNVQPTCRVHQAIVLTSGWDNLDLAVLTGLTDYYASFSEMATALNYTIYE